MIRKTSKGYCIYGDQSGRRMGCYPTLEQAKKRNRQIELKEQRLSQYADPNIRDLVEKMSKEVEKYGDAKL